MSLDMYGPPITVIPKNTTRFVSATPCYMPQGKHYSRTFHHSSRLTFRVFVAQVATGEGTVAPSAAAPASSLTLSPHASRSSSPLPSPAPMITEGATHAPQVAGPTPSPTVARASSGNGKPWSYGNTIFVR